MKVLQFDSTNVAVLTNLGGVLDDLNLGEEAIHYLEKVIRLYPETVGGYGNLAFRNISTKGIIKKHLN